MDYFTSWGDYFHFPDRRDSKSKHYVQNRQEVTIKYGNLLALFLLVFVICIPIINSLRANRYWIFNRVHVLRSTNHWLESLRRRSIISESLAARFRDWSCTVYLNYGTSLQLLLWVSVFTALCSFEICSGDLIFLSKRLGRLCVVSLPTVFFLTLRPSPLPRTLYLSLLPIHKWLLRIVVALAVIHTIIYCAYLVRNNNVPKIYKRANLFGWAALCGFFLIAITSLLKIRDRAYKVFFLNHYFWSWVIVLCLPFHVRPVNTTYANIANILLLTYQIFNRIRMTLKISEKGDLKIFDVSPNMAVIEFPNSWIKQRAVNPGAHVRITNWHPNILVRWYKFIIPNFHPYTLVTLPLDRYQRLVIRKSSFVWDSNRKYISYGSFDPKLLFIDSSNTADTKFLLSKLTVKAKKLLVVVGGSAISFAIPILRVANYHGIPIKVVWILRDYRDLSVLKCFDGLFNGDEFEIFVTGAHTSHNSNTTSHPSQIGNTSTSTEHKFALHKPSYGTILTASKYFQHDLEQNDSSMLLSTDSSSASLNQEQENVDVDFVETGEDEGCHEECQNNFTVESVFPEEDEDEVVNSNELNEIGFDDFQSHIDSINPTQNVAATSMSRKSSTSGFNEQFVPNLDNLNPLDADYLRTVQSLHLEHRIYRGRPVLNFRYYNWCLAANDTFTQCSGPVLDEESNLVCCKDLPGRQYNISTHQKNADLSKVWVISAGPKSLVKNTRLWANENGLKYHEEAFYV